MDVPLSQEPHKVEDLAYELVRDPALHVLMRAHKSLGMPLIIMPAVPPDDDIGMCAVEGKTDGFTYLLMCQIVRAEESGARFVRITYFTSPCGLPELVARMLPKICEEHTKLNMGCAIWSSEPPGLQYFRDYPAELIEQAAPEAVCNFLTEHHKNAVVLRDLILRAVAHSEKAHKAWELALVGPTSGHMN